ncbi:Imm50 family immunity protein [Sphingobacterium rhinopitheci]|uniref:Imm50 family immunity protein n=1 Tax=Sphingobacterium rhinopitheci TaxID=2781960 RepID=UPI001F51B6B3|nr:Imm50 family immunity protein [Sphingobacterium rhinopitheci]MCI0922608.1 hypothetical protein [Sphingobacterium rhinopitheci]
MLLLNIENRDIIKGIYKEKEPRLEDLTLREVSIITGLDVRLIVKFDTRDLPESLPIKWRVRNVNCVQFVVECVDVKLKIVDIIDECQHIKLEIHKEIDSKTVVFRDVFEKVVLALEVKWIYVRSIVGYTDSYEL